MNPPGETGAPPPRPSAPLHALMGGILGGLLGVLFSALVFYLLIAGFLYAQQTVHGKEQTAIPIPRLEGVTLAPPIAAEDLEPPGEKREEFFDTDFLRACAGKVWHAAASEDVGITL